MEVLQTWGLCRRKVPVSLGRPCTIGANSRTKVRLLATRMTHRVHILIDFENVQPTAGELESIRGSQYRVRIFHGPHQNKFDAAVVKAVQPLGGQVKYIQCGRNGKNALDFHIAFYLGRAVQDHENGGGAGGDRYLIVSKDGGFDALLEHLQSLGCLASKVPSISEAVKLGGAAPSGRAPDTPPASPTPPPPAKKTAAKTSTTPTNGSDPNPRNKILENLRAHPKNRPLTRDALTRHVATLMGNKPTPKEVEALVAGLERDGIVKTGDKKIAYTLPQKGK